MYIESEFWIIGIFQITCDSNLVESETVRQGGRGQTQGHNQDREGGGFDYINTLILTDKVRVRLLTFLILLGTL
jgi:hypothetical protein